MRKFEALSLPPPSCEAAVSFLSYNLLLSIKPRKETKEDVAGDRRSMYPAGDGKQATFAYAREPRRENSIVGISRRQQFIMTDRRKRSPLRRAKDEIELDRMNKQKQGKVKCHCSRESRANVPGVGDIALAV